VSIALDTNVIVNLVAGTTTASRRSAELLRDYGSRSGFVISPVVYAELFAHPGWEAKDVLDFLTETAIAVDWILPESVWTRAGHAFAVYAHRRSAREAAAQPRRLVADFVIGSHALEIGILITGDADFYRTHFPTLQVVVV
jgi:predicted nucleic acid-binding protein